MCYSKAENNGNDVWYFDFECSNHISGNKEVFSKIDDGFRSNITLDNNNIVEVAAKGAMDVQIKEGTKSFQDIYYTPKLKHNLWSVGNLCEKNEL